MLNCKITMKFVGLMAFSLISGFSTVICHDSNGHIVVKDIAHNHCECPKTDQNGKQDDFAGTIIGFSHGHHHCKDIIAITNIVISTRENFKPLKQKAFAVNLLLDSTITHASFASEYFNSYNQKSSSFHTPLQTVILIA